MTKYSFLTGLKKSLIQVVIFAVPIAVLSLPSAWTELTIGGLIVLVVNFLKFKAKEGGYIQ